MIRKSRGHKLILGYRDQPPADEQDPADCILTVANMAETRPEIAEIDRNPVFTYSDGIYWSLML